MNNTPPIKVLITDDHFLLREALSSLVSTFKEFEVVGQASNGIELLEKLNRGAVPDVVLLDLQMPLLDGIETAKKIKGSFPLVKIVALTMYQEEQRIIKMLRAGALAYLRKDSTPDELKAAIFQVMRGHFHYTEMVSSVMMRSVLTEPAQIGFSQSGLNDRHVEFLKLASTELTYKEVADKMNLSARTIDGYRDDLFHKLNVKSRVGLVLFAIRNRLVDLDAA